MTSYSCSIVTLALACTVSEIQRDITENSQLQHRSTLAEASRGLSKNCEAVM